MQYPRRKGGHVTPGEIQDPQSMALPLGDLDICLRKHLLRAESCHGRRPLKAVDRDELTGNLRAGRTTYAREITGSRSRRAGRSMPYPTGMASRAKITTWAPTPRNREGRSRRSRSFLDGWWRSGSGSAVDAPERGDIDIRAVLRGSGVGTSSAPCFPALPKGTGPHPADVPLPAVRAATGDGSGQHS